MKSVVDLLDMTKPLTEESVERAAKLANFRGNHDFITKDLIPEMVRTEVLPLLRTAQTADDLYRVQGMYRMLDKMNDHVKRGSKGPGNEK